MFEVQTLSEYRHLTSLRGLYYSKLLNVLLIYSLVYKNTNKKLMQTPQNYFQNRQVSKMIAKNSGAQWKTGSF